MNKRLNILLITVDSLRFDHLGCYGYKRDTSPNIDRLAKRGILFTQAISNGGNTPFSFPTMLASALPPMSTEECETIMRRHTALAELLQRAGYRTAAFHSNAFLSRFYSYGKGFEVFQDNLGAFSLTNIRHWIMVRIFSKPPPKSIYNLLAKLSAYIESFASAMRGRPIVSAQQLNGQAVSWLKSHDEPFFLWLHYMDVHNPYVPPWKYAKQFHGRRISRSEMNRLWRKMLARPPRISPDETETLKNLYDAEIRYVDDTMGWLVRETGSRLKNTIIVVTADHGEEFGEHGVFSHQSLYDGVLRVPLIMAGPKISKGIVKEQVSLADLAPTLASMAVIDSPASFNGWSLFPVAMDLGRISPERGVVSVWCNPQPLQRLISYRTPEWKYIRTESIDGKMLSEEVYNLMADSREKANLLGKGELLREIMGEKLQREVGKFRGEAIKAIEKLKKDKAEELTEFERMRVKEKIRSLKGKK